MEDYYKILGVNSNDNSDKIKKAFRKLSLKHHPDRGGDAAEFKKINEAYQTLGDPNKKQQYDIQKNSPFGSMRMGGGGGMDDIFSMMFGGGIPGMGGRHPHGGVPGMPFGFGGPGMPHVQVFHNGRPVNMGQYRKPSPIVKTINITLEQAYTGLNYPLKIEKWIMEGNVKKMENETIYIDITPGIDSNEIILLKNRGNVMSENNIGDVKVFVKIINNTPFKRDGLDLIIKKKISLKEALVGFIFDLKHLSGKTYTINNKTGKVVTPDFVKEVANMGMKRTRPHPASPLVGKLLICFEIEYPTSITEEQRKKLEEIL
jgi:DnaJ-class molecular chaperone